MDAILKYSLTRMMRELKIWMKNLLLICLIICVLNPVPLYTINLSYESVIITIMVIIVALLFREMLFVLVCALRAFLYAKRFGLPVNTIIEGIINYNINLNHKMSKEQFCRELGRQKYFKKF